MAKNEKKPIYQKWWFWVIIVICIGAIGGSSSINNSTPSTTDSVQEQTKPIEYTQISADVLKESLENNAATAKDTYMGKYLEITGRLGVIDSDLKYIGLYSITNKLDLTGIHCTIKNKEQKEIIKTLNKDDTIIVKGKITDVGEILGYYLDIIEISK